MKKLKLKCASAKGRTLSEEHKAKLSFSKGKTLSEELKRNCLLQAKARLFLKNKSQNECCSKRQELFLKKLKRN
jgi:hypothetical protein